MHELSIAESVLDTVRAERERRAGARICKVGLRIGALAGLDPEALRFGFEILVRESDLAPLDLEIEFCPRRQRCEGCGHEFAPPDYQMGCPACGATHTECIGGSELEIAFLEIEEGATTNADNLALDSARPPAPATSATAEVEPGDP